jgi:antitoxin component YwqK of YwqJK toxin-antitoxin module
MKRVPEEYLAYEGDQKLLDGEPFTGVGYYLYEEGQLEAEITYRDGVQMGLRRAWYPSGQLQHEYHMFRGVFHGKKREWHDNGRLAEEADYELGFKLRSKCWDEDGNLIEEFELDKNDPDYQRLEKYREAYKDDLEEEERRPKEL